MARIASNEKFKTSIKLLPITATTIICVTLMIMISPEIETQPIIELTLRQNILILNKIFNTKNSIITILIILYLIYTIIAINNIVKINEGPLRKKN